MCVCARARVKGSLCKVNPPFVLKYCTAGTGTLALDKVNNAKLDTGSVALLERVGKFWQVGDKPEGDKEKQSDGCGLWLLEGRQILPEVDATFATLMLQSIRQSLHKWSEVSKVKCRPQLTVRILIEWVEIAAQRPGKQHWILADTSSQYHSLKSTLALLRCSRPRQLLTNAHRPTLRFELTVTSGATCGWMARGSHSFTRHSHVYPQMESHSACIS